MNPGSNIRCEGEKSKQYGEIPSYLMISVKDSNFPKFWNLCIPKVGWLLLDSWQNLTPPSSYFYSIFLFLLGKKIKKYIWQCRNSNPRSINALNHWNYHENIKSKSEIMKTKRNKKCDEGGIKLCQLSSKSQPTLVCNSRNQSLLRVTFIKMIY